jgi:hypothetical protein
MMTTQEVDAQQRMTELVATVPHTHTGFECGAL